MGRYVVNGVGGNIGRIAADYALEIAGPDDQFVFTSTKPEAIAPETLKFWAEKGVEVAYVNFDDVSSMEKAFKGADAITVISTWFLGDKRRAQHKAAIDTAKAMGVKRVCYTSFVGADLEKDIPFLPQDHRWTEKVLRESGLEYNIQRNYLYGDNLFQHFSPSWKFCGNKWYNNSGGVPTAFVAREDCGRVLGALLLGKGEPNTVYAVSGPELISDKVIYEAICKEIGIEGEYIELTDAELYKHWEEGHGLPNSVYGDFSKTPMKLCSHDLISCGEVVRRGLMSEITDTVEKLTGRKPTPILELLPKYSAFLKETNK